MRGCGKEDMVQQKWTVAARICEAKERSKAIIYRPNIAYVQPRTESGHRSYPVFKKSRNSYLGNLMTELDRLIV